MKKQEEMRIHKGEAVFLEWQGNPRTETDNLWELRQQTKMKLLDGETPQQYVVTDVIDFYPGVINMILGDMNAMDHHLQTVTGDVDGEKDGAFSCVAFWDMHLREGVLVHRRGIQWFVAVLPALDAAVAKKENQAAMELTKLSAQVEGIPIRLDRTIEQGRHALSHLLDILSEQIDV